jgi:hypothetical protein
MMMGSAVTRHFGHILTKLVDRPNVRQAVAVDKSWNPPVDWVGTAGEPASSP